MCTFTNTFTPSDTGDDSKQEQKEAIAISLATLKGSNDKTNKKIDDAIKHIEHSLKEKLWEDGDTPDSKYGKKIFSEEKKAVKSIMKLLKSGTEDKCKGVTSLTVKYLGVGSVTIAVTDKNGDVPQDPDSLTTITTGGTITVGTGIDKFSSNTSFSIVGDTTETIDIHTSC